MLVKPVKKVEVVPVVADEWFSIAFEDTAGKVAVQSEC